jgi:glycosyltransferase involved in cell wall biosynthesis/peptidoglycan/xylan/chitin deacetylase (PgdA/CDA1 family)
MGNFKHLLLIALDLTGVNAALRHYNRGRVKTLIYHNVLPDTGAFPYALTPAEFERQIVLIKEKYNPVHLDESGGIVGLARDRINVLITFDDGFVNNYEYVFPILVKHGLKATFFLIVDCVEAGAPPAIADRYACTGGRTGAEYRTLSPPQIREMMAAGMTFGSHTFAHTDFTQIEWADGLSIARLSAERLGGLLGRDVRMFAFPWGRHRPGQPEALAASFRRVFTTDHGFSGSGDVVMRRDEAVNNAHLQAALSGSRDLLAGPSRAFAETLGQIARRAPRAQTVEPPFGDQFISPQAGDSGDDESKPLIAFVLPDLGFGGAEIVSVALGSEFLRRGFRADFVVGWHHEEAPAVLPPRASYVRLGAKRARDMLFPLARYLRERRPSAVIASLWPLTIITIAARKLAGSKARLAVCDHNTLSIQYGGLAFPHRLLLEKSISLAYPFADARIAVSGGVADDLSALSGLRRDDISVVPNPLFVRPASPADFAAAETVWSGWSGPRILTVGNLKPQKNHRLLIRAFKKLLARRDAKLLILGSGESEETRAYAQELGVADKVIFPGPVANPTAYYLSADIFVLSSDFEGFGNVIIEALDCGLPVVSTDCRYGPSEILAGGRYGRLTPVGDEDALARAILEALDSTHDPDALKRRAADFQAESVAESYLRLLFPQEAVSPSRTAAHSEA